MYMYIDVKKGLFFSEYSHPVETNADCSVSTSMNSTREGTGTNWRRSAVYKDRWRNKPHDQSASGAIDAPVCLHVVFLIPNRGM